MLEILHITKKGSYMNTVEKFHIYNITKFGFHMNETHIDTINSISEMLITTTNT
jgi:hypothetical protein